MRSRRGLVTFGIACTMHVLAFFAVRAARRAPGLDTPPPSASATQVSETTVDLTELPPETPAPSTAQVAFAAANTLRTNTAAERENPSPSPEPETPNANANTVPEPSAAPTASSDPGWHLSVFGNPPGPQAPSGARAAGSAGDPGARPIPGLASAALGAAKPASTTFGLREGLAQRDLEVGITRGGFVRSAVEAAVHSETAPASGTARYDVRVLRDGTATVVLNSASVDHAGFAALTTTIKKHIDPKMLRLPEGAKGLHVVIDVDIHDQYPDGRKPSDVGKVKGYVGPGEYDITKDGFIVKKMPGATIGITGKVCSGGVYIGPAGLGLNGGCSLENTGVPARRMGSAKVVSEALL